MSAFNVIKAMLACPKCGQNSYCRVQFKYGNTWQHEYNVEDVLCWGGNEVGDSDISKVVIDGVVETGCLSCGYGDWDIYIFVENGVLKNVETADGRFDFISSKDTYIAL